MNIHINPKDGMPIYRQIMDQIKYLIASQRLRPGDELPTVRGLASELIINPNTVAKAYRDLEHAGILTTRQGSGTFVSAQKPSLSKEACRHLLTERARMLVTESHHLGFSQEETLELVREMFTGIHANKKETAS